MPDRFQSMSAAQPGSEKPGADSSSANEDNEQSNTPDNASNTKTTDQGSHGTVDERATVSEKNPKNTPHEHVPKPAATVQDAVVQHESVSRFDGTEKDKKSDHLNPENSETNKADDSRSGVAGTDASQLSDPPKADNTSADKRGTSDNAPDDVVSGSAHAASKSASSKDTKALLNADDQTEKSPTSLSASTEDDALHTRRPIEPLPSQLKRLRRQDEKVKTEVSSSRNEAGESLGSPQVANESSGDNKSSKDVEEKENPPTKAASNIEHSEEDSTRSPVEPTSTQLSRVKDPTPAKADEAPAKQVKDTAQLSDAGEEVEDIEESDDQLGDSDSDSIQSGPPSPPGLKLYSDPTPRAAPSGLKKLQPRKPQTPDSSQKSSKSDQSEEPLHRSTLTFGMDDDDEELPKRDTAVLSKSNRSLQRQIRAQESNDGTATLGAQREVILVIRGMVERLVISEAKAFTLGRFELGRKQSSEIDLTPYGALDRGVSRVHARLHLQDNHLYVTDLGSTNGTYLAGKRLLPNTPALLRKGDELLIGRLMVQVMFR